MKKTIIIVTTIFLLASCWTRHNPIDSKLLSMIEMQAALDSTEKTTIEISPQKKFMGRIERTTTIDDHFWIKNTGNIDFNIVTIVSPCNCVAIKFVDNIIKPNDSLKVNYSISIGKKESEIKQAIIVIGNCDFGNQTYYTEAFINP